MELEQRVKLLEDELKILKNQIQTTLLEIQEQILVHYYPALRAESAQAGDAPLASLQPTLNAVPDPASAAPVPVVKSFTLKDAAPTTIRAVTASAPLAPAELDGETISALVEWASNETPVIGTERSRRAIEVYAQQKIVSSRIEESLQRMIRLHHSEDPLPPMDLADILASYMRLHKILQGAKGGDLLPVLELMEAESLG
ncbi:MAG: hypothetical protein ACYC5M_00740 [Anaerolineae bacterium]